MKLDDVGVREVMINHKGLISILLFMMLVSPHLLCLVPLVYATNTVTLNPIAYRCVSNIGDGEEYLVVRYEEGLKWISYVAFNLSVIPLGAEIETVKLKIKTYIVLKNTWVSVFNTSNTEWVKTGFSWDDKPSLDKLVATQWVTTWEEWYTWEHSYLTSATKSALSNTGIIGLALQSYYLIDVKGSAYFYSDAKLEITYNPDTSPPIFSNLRVAPSSPTSDDDVSVTITVTDDRSGVKEVYLYYSTDGGVNWVKISMSNVEDSKYKATIPRQVEGKNILCYIEAFDKALNKGKSDTNSYTVKSQMEIMLYGFAAIIILFGLPIAAGILLYSRRKKRKLSKSHLHGKIHCLNCGAELNEHDKFCPDCGHKIELSKSGGNNN